MIKNVYCLEDQKSFSFSANTAEAAINSMLYYLNLSHTDRNASITKTKYGYSLMHNGFTYWTKGE